MKGFIVSDKPILVPLSEVDYAEQSVALYRRSKEFQDALTENIGKNGLRYPVYATKAGKRWTVLDGICRCEACKTNHHTHIPAYEVKLATDDYLEFIITANHKKEKLPSERLEEARLLIPESQQGARTDKKMEQALEEQEGHKINRFDIGCKKANANFSGRTLRMYCDAREIALQFPDAKLIEAFDKRMIKSVNSLYVTAKMLVSQQEVRSKTQKPIEIPLAGKRKFTIYHKECYIMAEIENNSIQLTFTSIPYYDQRKYNASKRGRPEWGKESTVEGYIETCREVFLEVYRVLKFRGSVFVNIEDTYRQGVNNYVPFRFCQMMDEIGFHLLNTIIWQKPARMKGKPDRRLTPDWEYLFHFVKKEAANPKLPIKKQYYYKPFKYDTYQTLRVTEIGARHNKDATKTEPKVIVSNALKRLNTFFSNRKCLDIMETATASSDVAFMKRQYFVEHKAPFPLFLPAYALLTCSSEGDQTLDICMGSGTFAVTSMLYNRIPLGYECEDQAYKLCIDRCNDIQIGLEELEKEKLENNGENKKIA